MGYQTWFRVGSKDEEKGYTVSIADIFEHMMFKELKRYSGEELNRILQANGAVYNAFTTHDFTAYHEDLPSSKLELVMDIESDRHWRTCKSRLSISRASAEVVKGRAPFSCRQQSGRGSA